MRLLIIGVVAGVLALVGCHSAHIEATVMNHTNAAIPLIEVDYPSASFGTENLAPGKEFHYRFKVIGSGPTAVLWTDSAHQEHKSAGPELKESDDGLLSVTFTADGPLWNTTFAVR
jgi:hypothetical protein